MSDYHECSVQCETECVHEVAATLRAENARLREGLQTIATLTINFNDHSAVTMARFASNVLAGRKHFDDGEPLTGGPHE